MGVFLSCCRPIKKNCDIYKPLLNEYEDYIDKEYDDDFKITYSTYIPTPTPELVLSHHTIEDDELVNIDDSLVSAKSCFYMP